MSRDAPRVEEIFAAYDQRHGGHGYIPFSAADEALTSIGLDTSHGEFGADDAIWLLAAFFSPLLSQQCQYYEL